MLNPLLKSKTYLVLIRRSQLNMRTRILMKMRLTLNMTFSQKSMRQTLKSSTTSVVSEDIIAQSRDDGTAEVLLDGSESIDPHKQIWSGDG